MRHAYQAVTRIPWNAVVRRVVEYAIAVGAALISSYLILQGRW